jgi:very-short-patch-repair endonuclease
MALFTKKEYADKCNITTRELAVYIKRRKVFIDTSSMVDDGNAMNAQFLKKMESRPLKNKTDKIVEEKRSSEVQETPKMKRFTGKTPDVTDKFDERFDLDTAKRRMEIEKMQRESRKADMEHEKMLGNLLPTDPIRIVINQTLKSYAVTFRHAAEKIIVEFSKKAKMNRNDMAEMRGMLLQSVNKATDEGIENSKKSIQNIIQEYVSKKAK